MEKSRNQKRQRERSWGIPYHWVYMSRTTILEPAAFTRGQKVSLFTSVTCPTAGDAVSRLDELATTALPPRRAAPSFDNHEAGILVALRLAPWKAGFRQRNEGDGGGGGEGEERRGDEEKAIRRAMRAPKITSRNGGTWKSLIFREGDGWRYGMIPSEGRVFW